MLIYLQVSFLNNEDCKVLCTKRYIPNDSISNMKLFVLKRGMSLNYQHHFIVGKCNFTCFTKCKIVSSMFFYLPTIISCH